MYASGNTRELFNFYPLSLVERALVYDCAMRHVMQHERDVRAQENAERYALATMYSSDTGD